jgi:hypothetical protein
MKTILRNWAFLALVLFSAVLSPVLVWAQDAVPAAASFLDPQALVAALFAAGLPFMTQAIRHFAPGLPRMAVWAIPPLLGSLLGWLGTYGGSAAPGGWKGFALGLVAIALREAKSTFDQHGLNG